MPRPTRAYGRPGTRVLPENWERDHAPVVAKTRTAMIEIRPPAALPTFTPGEGYGDPASLDPIYTGSARIQALDADARRRLVGEQDQGTSAYLVAIDIDAAAIPDNSTIRVTASNDPWMTTDRTLIVRNADLGSLRFERDLYAVDDLDRPTTGG
ncbi:hypothetical protein HMPREF0063_11915 [Aeromicrobium marinum DSM 15272]|uniref:Uncharacterized protein n=1 Tax=Aeromicrobium marinum DSM 15272 TaxID=585531 RepID=E2SDX9_9ACTN|nr:DUF6093 family protein [Aeromicrobium marinum]EFQ82706.1 hypothetical protein HMPREF0063_11915 [Aeromicrobium marinum DSM 15272]